jgi:hypothetical protein
MRSNYAMCAMLAVGCGRVTSGDLSAESVCARAAAIECEKRSACTNAMGIVRNYGDLEFCHDRRALGCLRTLTAKDTAWTIDRMENCIDATRELSCIDYLTRRRPDECLPRGALEDGMPCVSDGQCAAGFCTEDEHVACGVCGPRAVEGDDCTNTRCTNGLYCQRGTQVCRAAVSMGASCGTVACLPGLACVQSQGESVCVTAETAVGAQCGPVAGAGCESLVGLYCSAGAHRTCQLVALAAGGQSCGRRDDGMPVWCIAGDCYTARGLASSSETGECRTHARDGEVCDIELGPGCFEPANCVLTGSGSVGICRLQDSTVCD